MRKPWKTNRSAAQSAELRSSSWPISSMSPTAPFPDGNGARVIRNYAAAQLADSLGVTTDEILGHRTRKQPGMRFAQQPQVIIGIGLVLISLWKSRAAAASAESASGSDGVDAACDSGADHRMLRLPMNKLSGMIYSGSGFFFGRSLRPSEFIRRCCGM